MTFFITLTCYGCHLHGQESGSVSRGHNQFRSRFLEADPARFSVEQRRMDQPACALDRNRREAALLERCAERHWGLLAAHVIPSAVRDLVIPSAVEGSASQVLEKRE